MKLVSSIILLNLIVPNVSFADANTNTNRSSHGLHSSGINTNPDQLFNEIPDYKRAVVFDEQNNLLVGDAAVAFAGFSLSYHESANKAKKLTGKIKFAGGLALVFGALIDGAIRVSVLHDNLDPELAPTFRIGIDTFKKVLPAVKLTDKSKPIPERLVDPATVAEARR